MAVAQRMSEGAIRGVVTPVPGYLDRLFGA
jgi:hypothetical protein